MNRELDYLKLLSKHYPTINAASKEIINLGAILELPKGTEHFLSDIHGEYEAFSHILRNGSGMIKKEIENIFGTSMKKSEKKSLATLIYYPEEKLDTIKEEETELEEWYKITLYRLVKVCRKVSASYTRSKVRKALPKDFSYILEELLHEKENNKEKYFNKIIKIIIEIDKADDFIIALSKLIQRLIIDRVHIIGDIYDRGPAAEKIMDLLLNYHSVDIQWGNHDIVWMGAASGGVACIANALRVSLRYGNLDTVENGYGINLFPLATLANEVYGDDDCKEFKPIVKEDEHSEKEMKLISKMQKAITIIQLKLEAKIIKKYPEFNMEDRLLLDKINFENGTIKIDDKIYKLKDMNFPTINREDVFKLSEEEEEVIKKLKTSFMNSEKLQKHVRFLFSNGSMYLKYNSNLLYHGCIPMDENGNFKEMRLKGEKYKGKALMNAIERYVRDGYFNKTENEDKDYGKSIMWYLWLGINSPLFGKKKMATFESYFLDDKEIKKEEKNPYYKYRDEEKYAVKILKEFGLEPEKAHIINGHVPVQAKKGENPLKAGGKLLVIDGGLTAAYQRTTGIAGYTLICDSKGLVIAAHEPFTSRQTAIDEEKDIISTKVILENADDMQSIRDTDAGKNISKQIEFLKHLLFAYRKGLIREKI
ncbi:fructose-1,6-bisphosphatase [Haliovirga abyssi]|uniref:fructose-1,6-bisphosphatase n=1 Tax=Haliovirga abyssi TaxID=2996794 RepID=UPI0027DDC79C|nr:fructose-1,6-bisphosphatase [Haliovirga abyssi]